MKCHKRSSVNKYVAVGLVVWFVLSTWLVAAGTLTLHLEPSLDSKRDIRATSITKTELLRMDYNGTVTTVTGTAAGSTALFNLSGLATNDYFIRVNDLADNLIPTRIDDLTKDITNSLQRFHPSTMTSINPPFSKWVFGEGSHGVDYGGNDSKCSICHGNLDTKPTNLDTNRDNFTDIPVNNGFCFRCHYGKSGTDAGFVGKPGCQHPYPAPQFTPATTTTKPTTVSYTPAIPTAIPTAVPTAVAPKTSGSKCSLQFQHCW